MFVSPGIRSRIVGLIFCLSVILSLSVSLIVSKPAYAQTNPTLGTAAAFAVLGSSTVTNTGPSVVNGDIGVSPGGSAITGFPPGTLTGIIHEADATALQAQIDATAAYTTLAGEPCTGDLTGQDLGGMTLTAGVYCFSSSAQLTGALTLDAQGDSNAVFIFRMGSTLTTASGSSVLVVNGGVDCNIWWQVESSATLGTTTSFAGNILALASITLTTGANVSGRLLVQTGAVTLDSNTVGLSACVPSSLVSGLSLTKNDGAVLVAPGGTVGYTLNYQNTGNVALNTVTLTDAIPADVTFNAAASTPGWNCAVSPCTFALGTLLPGASGSVVFAVTVNDATGATEINNTASITSGATTASASDTTAIRRESAPPPQAQTFTEQATITPVPITTSVETAPAVAGLPNAGGGPPQATYWMGSHR